MKTYAIAVIGCGGRSPAHIEAYNRLRQSSCRVVACAAPSPTRREPLAKKYGIKAYDDAEKMIQRERPDMVHIVTGPGTRVELMSLVASYEVPLCTVEKPIATSVADWRKLEELAGKSKTRFAVCHQFRWHKHLTLCREALQSGRLGEVKFLDISAGMNIAGQGTHVLNYGRSLINDPRVRSVFANAQAWDAEDKAHPGPVATEAFLQFDNGVRGLWTTGSVSPCCGDPSVTWQHVRVAAYADRGRVNFEEFGRWEIVSPAGVESGDWGGWDGWGLNNSLAQAAFHQAMFAWLEGGAAPGTNLDASLHEWAVVLALYQSALERRQVELAGFNPPQDLVERYCRSAC